MGDPGVSATKPTIWGPQKGHLKSIYQQAGQLSKQPWTYTPEGVGSYIPSRDPAYTESVDRLEAMGRYGNPVTAPSEQLATDTLGGAFLGSNPHLDAMYGRASENVSRAYNRTVLPSIEARFAQAGQTYSPQYMSARADSQRELGDTLGRMATDIYGGNYEAERGRQMAMLGMAPTVAGLGVADIERLRRAGAEREAYAGAQLGETRERHEFAQAEPWQRMQRYAGLLGAPITGSTTTTGGVAPWMDIVQKGIGMAGQLGTAAMGFI